MRVSVVATLLAVVVVGVCDGLTCYKCHGCQEGERGSESQCNSLQSHCSKIVLGSRIEKGCATTATCQVRDIEEGLGNLLSSFGGSDRDDSQTLSKVVHCCDNDYCNSATSLGVAAFLPLMASLLVLCY